MPAERPNIILIMTDQHNARCLSCAGEPVLKTPNIDGLAADGVRFTNAFSNSIHCGPSRVSFLTGMYEHTHRRHRNQDEPPDNLNPITSLLRGEGYQTAFVGKGHLGVEWPRKEFDYHRFDFLTDALPGKPLSCDYFKFLVDQGVADDFDRSKDYTKTEDPAITSPLPLEYCEEEWVGNESVKFLQNQGKNGPFFLFTSFARPHNPLVCPEPYDRLYDPDAIQLPGNWDDMCEGKSERQRSAARGEMDYPFRPKDKAYLQKCLAHYYAIITLIDAQVGKIVEELKRQSILDNTIIVFTADHGDFAGEHGFMYKNLGFYDAIHRIPLLVRYPRGLPSGTTFDRLTESVDLYPTLTEILGLSNPWTVQGRSLLKAVNREEPWKKNRVICEHVKKASYHLSMRTERYRITFDVTPFIHGDGSELYDYEEDPLELTNRWSDTDCRELREKLLMELLALRACPRLLHGRPPESWRPSDDPPLHMPEWGSMIMDLEAGKKWSEIESQN